jgi:hypothetical protein
MALGKEVLDIVLDLYQREFFKKINSVLDMGDQDVNVKYEEIKKRFNDLNINLKEDLWKNSKNFLVRPRVSSSILWNSLGINNADRMDIIKLERDKNDKNGHIIQDLNYPLENKELFGKYDLVTDLGNNEHPFNIVEAYRTMHRLCKTGGYMIVAQAYLNGNGFYQFDHCTIDNIAAVNSYSVIHSCFIINQGDKHISIPLDKDYLKLINLNDVKSISIFHILKKNSLEDFKFPYQGKGSGLKANEYYEIKTSYENRLPSKIYLPSSAEEVNTKLLIKILIKRLLKKMKI